MNSVRKGGVLRTLWLIFALSFILSYGVMCVSWIASGCKFGAAYCVNVFFDALVPCVLAVCAFEMISVSVNFVRIKRLERLYCTDGSCDEYYALLKKYLLKQCRQKDHGLLKLAACYCSDERFDDCIDTIDSIDLTKLAPEDENKYFELLLCSTIMSGELSRAQEIFHAAEHYLKRGLAAKHNAFALYTVGLYEFSSKHYNDALKCFEALRKSRDADMPLRFSCELFAGYSYLMTGDVQKAKKAAEHGAALTCSDEQEAELERLMEQVEKAYVKRTKDRSVHSDQTQQRKEDMPF